MNSPPWTGVEPAQWSALNWLSRALHVKHADLEDTLEAILARATTVISGAKAAGLNLMVGGRFEPQAVHGVQPPVLDALQKRLGTGPCIDASRDQVTIRVEDMNGDDRWPEYAKLAIELGVYSMLCLPLYVDDLRLGSLSLYGSEPRAFDGTVTQLAELFAAHSALALSEAQRALHLRRALNNRDVIGQAKGILMERHRITSDQAFELLSRASQTANRKLADLAEALVTTGELPTA